MGKVKIAYKYWNDTCTEQELVKKLKEVKQLAPNKTIVMIYYDDPLNVSIITMHTDAFKYEKNNKLFSKIQ